MGFTVHKGSEKGSEKGFLKEAFPEAAENASSKSRTHLSVRPRMRIWHFHHTLDAQKPS